MVCSAPLSHAGITLKWAGFTPFTPFGTEFVTVEGALLEILARHVYCTEAVDPRRPRHAGG
jgi:hypothetical protein